MTTSDANGEPPTYRETPDGLPPLREVIRQHSLTAKKSLGQNFIQDLNITRRIARESGLLADTTVVEIGPGPGGLTRALLLEGARHVIAIERDDRCMPALSEITARYPGRLTIHSADALDVDWNAVLVGSGSGDVRIIANLPYGIATRLLIGWLETEPWPPWFGRMTLMFQKEVAERITAAPATSAYGRLSIISQWRCKTRIVMTLGPGAFSPPPKIDSAVVELVPRPILQPACSVKTLGRVTAAAFGQRRKMLRSTLKSVTPNPTALLSSLGLSPEARGETLTVAQFADIAAAIDQA